MYRFYSEYLFFFFKYFREHAPSIIFMDEIDSIGSSRLEGGSGGMSSHKNILLVIIILVDSTIIDEKDMFNPESSQI